ncbi:MAG TPA: TIR domain-containing protein [Bryobacteraceae bacterium]|nr:TIR domain-containing protein [Bryobacteraceae bacterium]
MPYKAFISYSHEADAVTSAVQSALHRFAKPWYRLRALHVFRDQTSLAANPGLAASLENAMHGCDYLLLVATPQSAQSAWVKWEVACWLKERSAERILILLAGGEIVWNREQHDFDWDRTTSLPEELKGRFF